MNGVEDAASPKGDLGLRTIGRFLIGRADAIHVIASNRAAFWIGMLLVLLTAFPRNYDQTSIIERPLLWLFGPLLFSLVSGAWVFLVCYVGYARSSVAREWEGARRPSAAPAWRGFMGTFWMTAPIAWLYAIPVERFFDSLTAAKMNLALLGIVSLWRVLLMARVFQVVCRAGFIRCLLWVLVAAGIEVLVLFFFGGTFAQRIMAAMGGLRNSPEEDLLLETMSNVFETALVSVPVIFVLLAFWRPKDPTLEWPRRTPGRVCWKSIVLLATAWVAVTIPVQLKLQKNDHLEEQIATGHTREALDYMNVTGRDGFAATRPLPPKLYEYEAFEQVFSLAVALRLEDEDWVRAHVRNGLEVVTLHFPSKWGGAPNVEPGNRDPEDFQGWLLSTQLPPNTFRQILAADNRAPEVTDWLRKYDNFLQAVLAEEERRRKNSAGEVSDEDLEWQQLADAVRRFRSTSDHRNEEAR